MRPPACSRLRRRRNRVIMQQNVKKWHGASPRACAVLHIIVAASPARLLLACRFIMSSPASATAKEDVTSEMPERVCRTRDSASPRALNRGDQEINA